MNIIYFLFISFLYVVSPGPAVLMVIEKGINQRLINVFYFLLGNSTGLLILILLSSFGLIIFSNINTYMDIFASIYFIYLGTKLLFSTFKLNSPQSIKSSYSNGLLLSITNPKAILFIISIIPQFTITSNTITFIKFGCLFIITSFTSLFLYGYFANKIKEILRTSTYVNIYNKTSGVIFIYFGFYILFNKVINI